MVMTNMSLTAKRMKMCRRHHLIATLLLIFGTLTTVVTSSSLLSNRKEELITLLFANRKDVRLVTVDVLSGNLIDQSALQTHFEEVTSVDFFHEETIIFWGDIGSETIKGIRLPNGSTHFPPPPPLMSGYVSNKAVNIITSGIMSPDGLAVDWLTRKLYWADSETNRIEVSTFDGKNRRVLHWEDLDQPRAICLVPSRGFMFWTDWGEVAKIERSSMDGDNSTRRVIVDKEITWPNGLTVDYETGRLFWTDAKLLRIESSDFDGEHRIIVVSENLHHPFAVTVVRDWLFWTDWTDRSIHVCNKTSGRDRKEVIGPNANLSPLDVHVFSRERQPFFQTPCHIENGGCSHFCLLSSSLPGFTCSCPTGIKLLPDGKTCAPRPESILVFARRSDIRVVSLDTPDHTAIAIPVRGVKHSIAIEYDVLDERVFWTDDEAHVIRAAFLNGTGQFDVVNQDIMQPEGIAIDWIARNIYWTDTGYDKIEVSRLNGSSRRTLIWEGLGEPRAIAVHPMQGFFYWSDWGDVPRIERAALDGTIREVIINSSLNWPNGLTLDLEYGYIYWSDAYHDKIEMSTLNGDGRRVLVTDNIPHVFSLSIMDDWLYWTDWQKRTIERVRKKSGGERSAVLEHMPDLMGLKASTTDPSRLIGNNSCRLNNGNCSHLCLYLPPTVNLTERGFPSSYRERHICQCPNGYRLSMNDFSSCEFDPNYVKIVSTTKRPSRGDGGNNKDRGKNKDNRDKDNPCWRNGGCSHFCTPIDNTDRKCSCPDHLILSGDDKTCVDPPTCTPDQFACKSGAVNCVSEKFLCDGHNDCEDASDETNCPKCQPSDYKCPKTLMCIPPKKLCDGTPDCPDESDEECCQSTDFVCDPLNRKDCLHRKFLCDGNRDCLNGADEDKFECAVKHNHHGTPQIEGNSISDINNPANHPDHSSVHITYQGYPRVTFTIIGVVCLATLFAIFISICYFRKSAITPLPEQDIHLTHPLNTLSNNNANGRPSPFIGGFPFGGRGNTWKDDVTTMGSRGRSVHTPTIHFNGSQVIYEGVNGTQISSSSSSNHYPKETLNPPPSPESSVYNQGFFDTASNVSSSQGTASSVRGAGAMSTASSRRRLIPSQHSHHHHSHHHHHHHPSYQHHTTPVTSVVNGGDGDYSDYYAGSGVGSGPPPSIYSDYDLYPHHPTPYESGVSTPERSAIYQRIGTTNGSGNGQYSTYPSLPPPPPSPEPPDQ